MTKIQYADALRVRKDTTTLRERTATALRNAIFSMHLKPGQRLVERDLCNLTGVSRSSVREALRVLEAEGLVKRDSGQGMLVASLSRDEARQIYEVRAVLEAMAGRNFAQRADAADLKDLNSAYARLRQTETAKSSEAYVEALDDVYRILLRGAGNDVAGQLIGALKGRIHLLRALTSKVEIGERRRETIALMGQIVDAATARRANETFGRCREFVERSAAFADELLAEQEAAKAENESQVRS